MKQVLIPLFLLVLGCSQSSFTQTQESPIKLGLKAAPNIGWMAPETKHYDYDGITGGATIGLVADFYFAKNYAFSTGFNFAFLNGRITYGDSLLIDTTTVYGQLNRKYKFVYLDIPYMIKLQTNTFGRFSFFGQIGFSTGFRINAKVRDEYDLGTGVAPDKENSNVTSNTTLIRQAVIFGAGLEYHLDINTRIFFGVNYSNSLNNVLTGYNTASDLNEKSQLNFVELNIGVLF